jgi:hypothetical protein
MSSEQQQAEVSSGQQQQPKETNRPDNAEEQRPVVEKKILCK